MEQKVRRTIQFNDVEKMKRFIEMYNDLFQTLVGANENVCFNSSKIKGYEYQIIFHMSKENFENLKKAGIVKKIRQVPYDDNDPWWKGTGYKKDIWVLC